MTTFSVIESLCAERGIAITALEKELGFGRGSIGKLKNGGSMSFKRLQTVANYFNVSVDRFTKLDEETVNINEVLESVLRSLDNGTGLYPSGKPPQTDAEKELLANSIKLVMANVDAMDKK